MKATTLLFFIQVVSLFWYGTEAGVKQCYYCEETCEDPIPVTDCVASETLDYLCLSAQFVNGDSKFEFKDCAVNIEEVVNSCESMNNTDGTFCSLCDEDLCNL